MHHVLGFENTFRKTRLVEQETFGVHGGSNTVEKRFITYTELWLVKCKLSKQMHKSSFQVGDNNHPMCTKVNATKMCNVQIPAARYTILRSENLQISNK
jgi:hypothetical protein